MKFKECFQSSEDLEIKTLRSFFFNQSSFQKTNQLPFLEMAWLHSYCRNASNVHLAKKGLLKDKIMKKLLDGIQEIHFRRIPGTSTTLYHGSTMALTSLYYSFTYLYLTLLDPITLYHGYLTLLHSTTALLSSTGLYFTLLHSTMALLHST